MPSVEIDRTLLEAGIGLLMAGGDFANLVILAEADRVKADYVASFDENLAATLEKFR